GIASRGARREAAARPADLRGGAGAAREPATAASLIRGSDPAGARRLPRPSLYNLGSADQLLLCFSTSALKGFSSRIGSSLGSGSRPSIAQLPGADRYRSSSATARSTA